LIVDTLGRERTGQVEQVASQIRWSRDSGYETHVVGYRTQSAGIPISMVGMFRSWSLPMLYGERLLLGIEGSRDPNVEGSRRGSRRDTLVAVHPFAADRDHYYRYGGGDTVAVLTTEQRRIPILRVRVTPHLADSARVAAFDGEIDLDATTLEIVRMRGRFVINRPAPPSLLAKVILRATGTVGVAYGEFVNAQYQDRYWLPAIQRIELQANVALFGGVRSVVRVTSRFRDLEIADRLDSMAPTARGAYTRRRISFAPTDSMSSFAQWETGLGEQTTSVSADDFVDLAPPRWRSVGPPTWSLYPSNPERILRYDRVEGVFTGAELSVRLRDLAPGLSGRAWGGWAWTEATARGGVAASRTWSKSTSTLDAERSLVSTADFSDDFQGGSSLGALLASIEDVDYVDRWSLQLTHRRLDRTPKRGAIVGLLAFRRDVDEPARLLHGPVSTRTLFRPNRHSTTGTYGFGSIEYDLHPDVTGELLDPGLGGSLRLEHAAGELSWTRLECMLVERQNFGPLVTALRLNSGVLLGAQPPPQSLFEIGGIDQLESYPYKAFAGDRAMLFRTFALYGFPIFRAPHRLGRFLVPGLTPGLGAGVDGGWSGISNDATQRAVLALGDGTTQNAVSTATGRIRSSAFVGVTFFAGSAHIALTRPLDHTAPWRWVFGLGQGF
ncbi:MAG TPA: hypothetical protein VIV65_05545, partial [Gemmatimonadaceae bacterium]